MILFVGLGVVGSLGPRRALFPRSPGVWNVGGIVVLAPRSSVSTHSVLLGDIWQAGVRHMVGGGGGAASVFRFHVRSFFNIL